MQHFFLVPQAVHLPFLRHHQLAEPFLGFFPVFSAVSVSLLLHNQDNNSHCLFMFSLTFFLFFYLVVLQGEQRLLSSKPAASVQKFTEFLLQVEPKEPQFQRQQQSSVNGGQFSGQHLSNGNSPTAIDVGSFQVSVDSSTLDQQTQTDTHNPASTNSLFFVWCSSAPQDFCAWSTHYCLLCSVVY